MRMNYNWLVAGMLAVASAVPVLSLGSPSNKNHESNGAVDLSSLLITVEAEQGAISDALAYRILDLARGPLEAQLNASYSLDELFYEFKQGQIVINYITTVDGVSTYQVAHTDGGGSVIVDLDDF